VQELLERVKEVTLGAYTHAEVPFEKVVRSPPARAELTGAIHSSKVVLVLHNWPKSAMRLPGLTISIEDEVDEPSILDFMDGAGGA